MNEIGLDAVDLHLHQVVWPRLKAEGSEIADVLVADAVDLQLDHLTGSDIVAGMFEGAQEFGVDAVNLHVDVVAGCEVAISDVPGFADVGQGDAVGAQFQELVGSGDEAGITNAAGEIAA